MQSLMKSKIQGYMLLQNFHNSESVKGVHSLSDMTSSFLSFSKQKKIRLKATFLKRMDFHLILK